MHHSVLKKLLQKRIYDEQFIKTCLNPELKRNTVTDCVINSIYFLDFIDEITAKEYSKIANSKKGLKIDKTIEILFDLFKRQERNINFKLNNAAGYKSLQNIFKNKLLLEKGYGTVAFFSNNNTKTGHAVVIARNILGELIIIDLQQERIYKGEIEINSFINTNVFDNIILLYDTFKRKSVSIGIRKSPFKNTRKKTRRLSPESNLKRKRNELFSERFAIRKIQNSQRKTKKQRTNSKKMNSKSIKMDVDSI